MLPKNPTKQSDSELNVSVETDGDSMKVESTQNSPDDIMAHINLVFSDDPADCATLVYRTQDARHVWQLPARQVRQIKITSLSRK